MKKNENIIKMISKLLETSVLTSQDVRKELKNKLEFQRDNIIDKLRIVSRDEFEIMRKIVSQLENRIKELEKKKNKKIKKVRKS
tara:strand:- start:269 stop:520 length:252 start_codon:yes stop_codon:yes gene_type:complete